MLAQISHVEENMDNVELSNNHKKEEINVTINVNANIISNIVVTKPVYSHNRYSTISITP